MKFIPYAKMQKRKQREIDRKKRRDFGAINPVTRKADNPKAYKRKRAGARDDAGSFIYSVKLQPFEDTERSALHCHLFRQSARLQTIFLFLSFGGEIAKRSLPSGQSII